MKQNDKWEWKCIGYNIVSQFWEKGRIGLRILDSIRDWESWKEIMNDYSG